MKRRMNISKGEMTGPITVDVKAPLGKPPVFYRRASPWTELFVRIKEQFS